MVCSPSGLAHPSTHRTLRDLDLCGYRMRAGPEVLPPHPLSASYGNSDSIPSLMLENLAFSLQVIEFSLFHVPPSPLLLDKNEAIYQTKPKWGLCLGITILGLTSTKTRKNPFKIESWDRNTQIILFTMKDKHKTQIDILKKYVAVYIKRKESNRKITWKEPSPEQFCCFVFWRWGIFEKKKLKMNITLAKIFSKQRAPKDYLVLWFKKKKNEGMKLFCQAKSYLKI